jgi:hypothetical protein
MARKVRRPLVIDLGQIKREDIDELVSGGGRVLDEVDMAIGLVRERIDFNGSDQVLLPMVVVYTREEDAGEVPDRLVVKVRARKS